LPAVYRQPPAQPDPPDTARTRRRGPAPGAGGMAAHRRTGNTRAHRRLLWPDVVIELPAEGSTGAVAFGGGGHLRLRQRCLALPGVTWPCKPSETVYRHPRTIPAQPENSEIDGPCIRATPARTATSAGGIVAAPLPSPGSETGPCAKRRMASARHAGCNAAT